MVAQPRILLTQDLKVGEFVNIMNLMNFRLEKEMTTHSSILAQRIPGMILLFKNSTAKIIINKSHMDVLYSTDLTTNIWK